MAVRQCRLSPSVKYYSPNETRWKPYLSLFHFFRTQNHPQTNQQNQRFQVGIDSGCNVSAQIRFTIADAFPCNQLEIVVRSLFEHAFKRCHRLHYRCLPRKLCSDASRAIDSNLSWRAGLFLDPVQGSAKRCKGRIRISQVQYPSGRSTRSFVGQGCKPG